MSIIHSAPSFTYAVMMDALAVGLDDSTDLAQAAVGIHNKGTGGTVKVRFHTPQKPGDHDATLFIAQGEFLIAPIRRVFSTGTAVAEGDLAVLYP